MSRLSPPFLDDEDDTSPTLSSEKIHSPMEPTRAAPSFPEHHDIFTDDEGVHENNEPGGPSLDTESNIGRITKIREDVEELNMKFKTILPKMLSDQLSIQEEDTEPKEITLFQSAEADRIAEELCVPEAIAISKEEAACAFEADKLPPMSVWSMAFTDSRSSADVPDVLSEVPDTSGDADYALALSLEFQPRSRATAQHREYVALNYQKPKIELLTRKLETSPALPWHEAEEQFNAQVKVQTPE